MRHIRQGNEEIIGRVIQNFTRESLKLGEETEELQFRLSDVTQSMIKLSFKVLCAENFYGDNCSRFCNESCICDDPGYFCNCNSDFNGENCNVSIGQATNIKGNPSAHSLTTLLIGIAVVLFIIVILLLVVVGAMALFIRAMKRKKGDALSMSSHAGTVCMLAVYVYKY